MEVLNHLTISYELKCITRDQLLECRMKIDEISAMLTALRNSTYRPTSPPPLCPTL